MKGLVVPSVHGMHGLYWCAGWYAVQALFLIATLVFMDGLVAPFLVLALVGLYTYVAIGLLRALKPAWHFATFIAFLSIIVNAVAIACAPGEIADHETTLAEAALDVVSLALFVLVYAYLRKPSVREIYGVPANYQGQE